MGCEQRLVLAEIGPVEIEVPRDRDGTFEPVILRGGELTVDVVEEPVELRVHGVVVGLVRRSTASL
jgi:transposase-like protein